MHSPKAEDAASIYTNEVPQLPRPPNPSADSGIALASQSTSDLDNALPNIDGLDISTMSAEAALRMLCRAIEALICMIGDIPPTPPISRTDASSLGVIQVEKENFARHTKRSSRGTTIDSAHDADEVPAKAKTPIGSPEAHPAEPLQIIGSNKKPLGIQHGAITRKFYSKKPPPITLEEYLLRLHSYCPMSTAVYLATSLYIHRLAVEERIIPVTARNAHRLVLAGLRVAMKALEDLSYPHRRFARVGGVSEPELGRLEISFCFITNFELRVDEEVLNEHARFINEENRLSNTAAHFHPHLPLLQDKRNPDQHKQPATAKIEAPPAA